MLFIELPMLARLDRASEEYVILQLIRSKRLSSTRIRLDFLVDRFYEVIQDK